MQVKVLFDANLSTVQQFTIDDALAGINILLLVPNLPPVDKYTLCAMENKIQNLIETYLASSTDRATKIIQMVEFKSLDATYKVPLVKIKEIVV